GFGSCKSYRPKTAYTRQREPRVSLIGSPSGAAVVGRNHHGATVVSDTDTRVTYVAQAEDGSRNWRRAGKSPGLTAIAGSCRASVVGIARVQITAPPDSVLWLTKIDLESACPGVAYQGRVLRIPSVASVSGGEAPCNIRSPRTDP